RAGLWLLRPGPGTLLRLPGRRTLAVAALGRAEPARLRGRGRMDRAQTRGPKPRLGLRRDGAGARPVRHGRLGRHVSGRLAPAKGIMKTPRAWRACRWRRARASPPSR